MQDITADQDWKLWVLFNQAHEAAVKLREHELRKFGSTMTQVKILFIIKAMGGAATLSDISRWTFRERHSISEIVNRMERDGLVRKNKNLGSNSMIQVTLTEKGEQIYRLSEKRESIHRIFHPLSERQRQQLTENLEIMINHAFKELERKPPWP